MSDDLTFDADAETVGDEWVGTVLYTSWGYGQTNVELAEITEVSGTGKTVKARLVTPETTGHGRTSEQIAPTDRLHGEAFRLHVRECRGDPIFKGSYPYVNGDPDDGERMGQFSEFENTRGESISQTATGFGH